MASDLECAADAEKSGAELVFQTGVDVFGHGAEIVDQVVEVGPVDELQALDFAAPFGLGLVVGAKVGVDDRSVAQRPALVVDRGGVVGGDDAACAAYLGRARWPDGFVCPHCGQIAEPFRIVTRPGVLECRACRRQAGLLVGAVMERSHTPLSVWFWAAYLVASQTMSAVQFQRQLGLTRYETAFGILHKLRAGMVRPDQNRIGGRPKEHVEVDETWVGGRTRGEGRGIHYKTLVAAAVEVRNRKPGTAQDKRKDGRYAGRVRLAIAADRSADALCGFVENAVMPGSLIVTDDWSGYASLRKRGYDHHAIAESGDPEVAEQFMPMIHLAFSNLKTWLNGIHHGVSAKHLQAYLNEFTFRFNRRFYPFNAFRSLLGIAGGVEAPTYADLYSGAWTHPTSSGCLR